MPLSRGTKDAGGSPEKYRGVETFRIFPHENHLASASLRTAWSSGKVNLRLMIMAGNGETENRSDKDIRDQEGLFRRWHDCEFRAELIGLGNFPVANAKIPTSLIADFAQSHKGT
jgi:hypothetical protein